jgi:thiol:disulfide interchange protein
VNLPWRVMLFSASNFGLFVLQLPFLVVPRERLLASNLSSSQAFLLP